MKATSLRIIMAQINFLVGDIDGNANKMIQAAGQARDQYQADVIVFSELSLCGYPPEDLLLRPSLSLRIQSALAKLYQITGITLILGAPIQTRNGLENQALALHNGQLLAQYSKQKLPNYRVFDEKRYFVTGCNNGMFTVKGYRLALSICEDLWFPETVEYAHQQEADILLSLNASPFSIDKTTSRQRIVAARIQETGLPIVYVNQVGGQDELVFDGNSFVMRADGSIAVQADAYQEGLYLAIYDNGRFLAGYQATPHTQIAAIYQALVFAVKDYVNKNGFSQVLIGLSGGIDSALTLAIATDALGADRVQAVMMPSRYTASISQEDAATQAKWLQVAYHSLNIEPTVCAAMDSLTALLGQPPGGTATENLQSRCRGLLLMALSNHHHALVLTTGNKSEMAVGYATLYGDMAGGFNALKDISKTRVYELARYRNALSLAIPPRVIERAPSAELAADQQDSDTLPDYNELDAILSGYLEEDDSAETLVAKGFDPQTVESILKRVDQNEFKRRQAAPGVRITERGFGRDRRYPITHGWLPGK